MPSGKLSEKITHSKIYDGMKSEYWIYVPAQYDPHARRAHGVSGWREAYPDREGNNPVLNVIDNLIAQKKIPVMICVFINPGDVTDSPGTPTYDFRQGVFGQMAPHAEGFHAQHALRHGERPVRALPARRSSGRGRGEIQHPQRCLQPGDHGAVVGRDLQLSMRRGRCRINSAA